MKKTYVKGLGECTDSQDYSGLPLEELEKPAEHKKPIAYEQKNLEARVEPELVKTAEIQQPDKSIRYELQQIYFKVYMAYNRWRKKIPPRGGLPQIIPNKIAG